MKQSAKKRIIVWSAVSLVLLALLAVGVFAFSNSGFIFGTSVNLEGYESGVTASYSKDKVKSLNINWESGEVRVQKYSGTELKLEELETQNPMYWQLSGDKLTVYGDKQKKWFSFGGAEHKILLVQLPGDNVFDSVEINCVSAKLTADVISSESIVTDTVSGEVKIDDLQCSRYECNTVSGSVTVTKSNCEKASFDSVSGKLDFGADSAIKNLDVNTISGDVLIRFPADINGFSASLESVSGDLSTDFAIEVKDKRFIYGDGSASVSINTVSGKAEINQAQ